MSRAGIALVFLALAGCGVKAPPRPPKEAAAPVQPAPATKPPDDAR